MHPKFVSILSVMNFLLIMGVISWLVIRGNHKNSLEHELEELTNQNPQLFVSLLNKSANMFAKNEEQNIENKVLEEKEDILKAGICIKKGYQESLIIFADMADANSLSYLKNVKKVLNKLACSVYVIPIAIFGDKSIQQGIFIIAAAMQNPQKAIDFALTFDPAEGAKNNLEKEAKKQRLNFKKLISDSRVEKTRDEILAKTLLAETIGASAPFVLLIKKEQAYMLPPSEAADLLRLIDNPRSILTE